MEHTNSIIYKLKLELNRLEKLAEQVESGTEKAKNIIKLYDLLDSTVTELHRLRDIVEGEAIVLEKTRVVDKPCKKCETYELYLRDHKMALDIFPNPIDKEKCRAEIIAQAKQKWEDLF